MCFTKISNHHYNARLNLSIMLFPYYTTILIMHTFPLPSTDTLPSAVYHYLDTQPHSVLLESSLSTSSFGRYSIIGMAPQTIMESSGTAITVHAHNKTTSLKENPFTTLKRLLQERHVSNTHTLPTGAAIGYLGYGLKDQIETLPSHALNDLNLPECRMGFYNTLLIIDNHTHTAQIVGTDTHIPTWATDMVELLQHPPQEVAPTPIHTHTIRSTFTHDAYIKTVQKIKEYILAGDIYQANLAQRFSASLKESPINLYRTLQQTNPAPFAAYLDCGAFHILSSSPERFLRMQGQQVETRPIKGTRPRGTTPQKDRALQYDLMTSEKDRAELLMITDLKRNDLGKVCSYGSVHVPSLYALESYETVHHLVATVRGTLRENCAQVDCLQAAFPGGSITGAPKIRAMEIIEELEPVKRHVYTGSIGYFGYNGISDFNIAIRTMIHTKNTVHFHAGGGIVADSDPHAEYEETLHKAEGMLRALHAQFPPKG